jgi:hypothetical protein
VETGPVRGGAAAPRRRRSRRATIVVAARDDDEAEIRRDVGVRGGVRDGQHQAIAATIEGSGSSSGGGAARNIVVAVVVVVVVVVVVAPRRTRESYRVRYRITAEEGEVLVEYCGHGVAFVSLGDYALVPPLLIPL